MTARARRRRRRALAVVFVAGSLLSTASFWLADVGVATPAVTPVAGLSPTGSVAAVTPLTATLTRPNGNAQIQMGVSLARVEVAAGFAKNLKLDLAWLNPQDADQVLNNPNAQIHVGFYHPIKTGACSGTTKSVNERRATVNDNLPGTSGAQDYCTEIDDAATGSVVLPDEGKLLLAKTNIAGFLRASVDDSGAATCTGSTTSWCRPSGYTGDKSVFWIVATIVTPGGKPAGQQNGINDLDFYMSLAKL